MEELFGTIGVLLFQAYSKLIANLISLKKSLVAIG